MKPSETFVADFFTGPSMQSTNPSNGSCVTGILFGALITTFDE